jgi:hypothetical protein
VVKPVNAVEPLVESVSSSSRGSVNVADDEVVKPVNAVSSKSVDQGSVNAVSGVVKPVNAVSSSSRGSVNVADDGVSPPRPLSNSKMVKPVP